MLPQYKKETSYLYIYINIHEDFRSYCKKINTTWKGSMAFLSHSSWFIIAPHKSPPNLGVAIAIYFHYRVYLTNWPCSSYVCIVIRELWQKISMTWLVDLFSKEIGPTCSKTLAILDLLPRKTNMTIGKSPCCIGNVHLHPWLCFQPVILFFLGVVILSKELGVSKNSGFSPQIIHFNRVFHYFHHPFWGITIIFGNIQLNYQDTFLPGKLYELFHDALGMIIS